MVAVLAAFGAAFLIWFHNDPRPKQPTSVCEAPAATTQIETGPWYEELRIETNLQTD